MKDLLLEIGTEEIPARFLSPALKALSEDGRARLEKAGFSFQEVRTVGTPRRLALVVTGLSAKARDVEQEFLGPSLAQAKDAAGHWTGAAQGFARNQGIPLEKLGVKETDRGPRLVFIKKTPGAPAEKVLPSLFVDLIRALPFPKSMVWEESRVPFARPIRWIVALCGAKPLALTVAGVKSGRRTFGLRFQSARPFDVPSPDRYAALLKNHCVIVDPNERRKLIVQQIEHVAKTHHGHIPLDRYPDLLEEVSHLVEHPVAVVGKFDPRFLAVPLEVLVVSMKKHQKYFPVFKDESCRELLPCFVAVRNGLSDNQAVVREGYERVLAARLSDAAFFFGEHAKRSLASREGDLAGVAFLSPTLTLKDKTERVVRLAVGLAQDTLRLSADEIKAVERAARLAKADLTTGLVGEFPELQGTVGRLYAERDNETSEVARALEEHYWPLTAEGTLPSSVVSSVVSVADKLDTLAGNFLAGKIPSGSQDPYGLRRAAVGVLRILESRRWPVSVPDWVDRALSLLPAGLGDADKARRSLADFFQQRWAALALARGFRSDEVDAVTSAGLTDVGDAWARLTAIRDVRRHPDFGPLSVAFKRVANVLKQAEKKGDVSEGAPQADLFRVEAETVLAAETSSVASRAHPLLAARDYNGYLSALVSLRAPVDAFFVQAVVMDPDPDLRRNRLRMLASVRALFDRVADFSRLQDTAGAAVLSRP
ncbi:MAG: glycine--tRNA ligase subunit beta [Elusimicrobia bacterium]|nr:glycine--tRNA ligase subunit beta [Elusimicrobiota bacterium]